MLEPWRMTHSAEKPMSAPGASTDVIRPPANANVRPRSMASSQEANAVSNEMPEAVVQLRSPPGEGSTTEADGTEPLSSLAQPAQAMRAVGTATSKERKTMHRA